MRKIAGVLVIILVCSFSIVFAEIPPKPLRFNHVMDYANTIKPSDEAMIRQYCEEVLKLEYAQVSVLTVDTFDGVDGGKYGTDIINTWGLGGDSVLIVLATNDREINVCTGRYIDTAMTPDVCGQILDKNIMYLANNDFSVGLREITKDICLQILVLYSPLFEDVEIDRN